MARGLKGLAELLSLYFHGFTPVEFVRGDDRITQHASGWRVNGSGRLERAKDAMALVGQVPAEEWRQVYCGINLFLVSDRGEVKKHDGTPADTVYLNGRCQIKYQVVKYGRLRDREIYRSHLVAMAFLNYQRGDEREIHHINGYRNDDSVANLVVLSREDHAKVHAYGSTASTGLIEPDMPLPRQRAKKSEKQRRAKHAGAPVGLSYAAQEPASVAVPSVEDEGEAPADQRSSGKRRRGKSTAKRRSDQRRAEEQAAKEGAAAKVAGANEAAGVNEAAGSDEALQEQARVQVDRAVNQGGVTIERPERPVEGGVVVASAEGVRAATESTQTPDEGAQESARDTRAVADDVQEPAERAQAVARGAQDLTCDAQEPADDVRPPAEDAQAKEPVVEAARKDGFDVACEEAGEVEAAAPAEGADAEGATIETACVGSEAVEEGAEKPRRRRGRRGGRRHRRKADTAALGKDAAIQDETDVALAIDDAGDACSGAVAPVIAIERKDPADEPAVPVEETEGIVEPAVEADKLVVVEFEAPLVPAAVDVTVALTPAEEPRVFEVEGSSEEPDDFPLPTDVSVADAPFEPVVVDEVPSDDWEERREAFDRELEQFLAGFAAARQGEGGEVAERARGRQVRHVYRTLRPFYDCDDAVMVFDTALSALRRINQFASDRDEQVPGVVVGVLSQANQMLKGACARLAELDEVARACTIELLEEEAEAVVYRRLGYDAKLRKHVRLLEDGGAKDGSVAGKPDKPAEGASGGEPSDQDAAGEPDAPACGEEASGDAQTGSAASDAKRPSRRSRRRRPGKRERARRPLPGSSNELR